MHPSIPAFCSKLTAPALALLVATLWLLMRGYHGLTADAQIYAFQAMARIHPHLASDLYLQNTSQDQFTLFSPLYARFIAWFGLENAARFLTVTFTAWLLAAAWSLVRALTDFDAAWLATAFLLVIAGDYGGAGVFRFPEPYLTARLPAEALIVTALACYARGAKWLDLLLALAAMFVHPLMALPGLIWLICLRLPSRLSIGAMVGGVLASFGLALIAIRMPQASGMFSVMEGPWLEVVRERSQFLFLSLWSAHDWDTNARPFLYLAFTAIAVPDARIRKFCVAAALVGAGGLAVALIGSGIGPVTILVQGQAWRWIWIAVLLSGLLLPYTVLHAWRDPKCGPMCAMLLVCGWTVAAVDGTACVSAALVLWMVRRRLGARMAPYLRYLAIAMAFAVAAWVMTKSWDFFTARPAKLPEFFGLKIPAVVFGVLIWWWLKSSRGNSIPASICALLIAVSALLFPVAFKQSWTLASAAAVNEFSDWRQAIPATSTVLVTPAPDVGAFVWFTLDRPNYLAVDQSAGVVFSRVTALEVQRRSQVLLPLMDPNWKILSNLRATSAGKHTPAAASRPLTAASLRLVCADPQLGFVVSRDYVGFEPIRHSHGGAWQNWNLYDCRNARPSAQAR
jgi:hypothetical protein